MNKSRFNAVVLSTLFLFFVLRPLLDTVLACTGPIGLPFLGQGGRSFQSFVSVFSIFLCWVYIAANRKNMPVRLIFIWILLSLSTVLAFFRTQELMVSLGFFFRIQVWFCLFFVFQSLGPTSPWRKKFIAAGLGVAFFYVVASITDTLVSGGKICEEHRIWEMARALYPMHQYSQILGVVPFLFLTPYYWNEKRTDISIYTLCLSIGMIIFFTGVRHVWLGFLAFFPFILMINQKSVRDKTIKIIAGFLFLGFVGGVVAKPYSFINRFGLEIPIVVFSMKKVAYKISALASSRLAPPPEPQVAPSLVEPVVVAKAPPPEPQVAPSPVEPVVVAKAPPKNDSPEAKPFNPEQAELETKQLIKSAGIDVLPNKIHFGDLGNSRFQAWTAYSKTWWRFGFSDKILGQGYDTSLRTYGREPHSDFFRLLLDLGLLGLILTIWFLWSLIQWACFRIGHDRTAFSLFISTLVLIIVVGLFSGILANVPAAWYLATFLGLTISLINRKVNH